MTDRGDTCPQTLGEFKMNYSVYQKILEESGDMDSAKRSKLLRIYLHIPSLPRLRAIRASLAELKETLKRKNGSMRRFSNGK